MANCKVVEKKVPVTTYKTEKTFVLELNENEVKVILTLTGALTGDGHFRKVSSKIYETLMDTPGVDLDFYWDYRRMLKDNPRS